MPNILLFAACHSWWNPICPIVPAIGTGAGSSGENYYNSGGEAYPTKVSPYFMIEFP